MKDITNIKVWTKLTKRFSIDKHASVDSYLTLDLLAAHPHFKTWQCCCKAFLFCFLHLSRIKAWFQIVWLVLEGGVRFKVADVGRDCISIPACENCHSSAKKMFWINFCHLAWYICSNSASAVPSKQHRLSRTVHTNHIQILTNRHKPGRNAVTPTKGATLEHYVSDHMAFTMAWIYFAKDCAAYFRSQECAYMCIKYCILYGVFLSI